MDRSAVARLGLLPALACAVPAFAGDPVLPDQSPHKTLGVASCASSLCHGSVQPWNDTRVRQDEYVIWSRHDPHARSYAVLLNEKSREMARKLRLPEPAHETPACLACHTHYVPEARRPQGVSLTDGVQCESCHGPAERWIDSHVEKGATRAKNVARGLFPTHDAVARGRLCMGCHFGNEDKLVTHRMMAAGHPRLAFELDTFTHLQPPHYGGGRGAAGVEALADGVRNWAIGQALMADTLLALLVHPQRGRDGFFPELVLFDCHACHHPMSNKRAAWARLGVQPGAVRLNDANLIMVRQIARRVAPAEAARLVQANRALVAALAEGGDVRSRARELRQAIGRLLPAIEEHRFSAADLRGIFRALIDDGLAGEYSDYQGAEQAAMALQALADFMSRRGMVEVPALRPGMERMMAAVANDEAYRAGDFAAALRELRIRIEQARATQ